MKSQFLLQVLLAGLLQTAALADMPPPRPEPPDPEPLQTNSVQFFLPNQSHYSTILAGVFLAAAGLLFGFSRKPRALKVRVKND